MTRGLLTKLLADLERDIRNQVTIDNMLRLNRRQRLQVWWNRDGLDCVLMALAITAFVLLVTYNPAFN